MGVCFHSLDTRLAHRMYLLAGAMGEGRFALPWVNAAVLELYGGDGDKSERYLDLYFEGVGGWGYGGVGEGAWDEDAVRDGTPCDERSPRVGECVLALNNLSASYNSRKMYSKAIAALRRALEIADDGDVSLPLMYFNMASAQLELGDNVGAEESFTKGFRFRVERGGDGEGAMAFLIRRALSLPKVISGAGEKSIIELRERFRRRVEGVTKFARWQRGEGEALSASETAEVFGYLPSGKWPVLTVPLAYNYVPSCSLLSSLKLDILVFLEMQNEATAHILGYGRFAPVQCLIMGSPVTAGNGGIDYFISFERAEAREEDDYGEQLVLFQGLGISYPKPEYEWREMGVGEEEEMWDEVFGIPREFVGARKYTCGQHVFKLHPSFDDVIIGILERDREGIVLLQSSGEPATTDIVKERLMRKAGEDITGRILYLPRVSSAQFFDLLRYSNVVLHPFPFGGSKTSSDAFWVGGRLVVMGGMGYLRGRMARAYYAEVGGEIEGDVVAVDTEDYVDKAVRIGTNAHGVGDKVRKVLERERGRIFGDVGVREEWYRWLERVVGHGDGAGRKSEVEDWDWEVVERIKGEWKGGFDVVGGL
ncbi:hypothetical protein TrRE_jg7768 [Triparma retinervis]|uniref:O-GlcNAc transferase C-terminal domain-containing protein n=1 Tax=Triparma retinervis TaxID=2557542 RepID=A0A9W7KSW4_9STRA|nr:hypothetical protein TrRE_jg7768 [Triparma retinervis]